MDLIDQLKVLSQKILKIKDNVTTEEATKNALIMPFISLLGYDVFDPDEVVPEYTADIGTKKGEKVDYAIFKDGHPIMFFECKKCGSQLDVSQASQLYRYFATNTKIKVAVLTNGINYEIYSDLDEQNIMDSKPFLEINLLDIKEALIPEIKKLCKNNFDLETIVSSASELKYLKETKNQIAKLWQNPSEDFVKFIVSQVYTGTKTQKVLLMFNDIVKRALKEFINEEINTRIKAVIDKTEDVVIDTPQILTESNNDTVKSSVITTEEETEAFYIIKSIVRETIDSQRVSYKDTVNYFSIIVDDSVRKPICRLYLNSKIKYIGLFDTEDKKEEKIQLESLDDLYNYSERLKECSKLYI